MGKGGGGRSAPAPPSPEAMARAQAKVQEEMRLKKEAEDAGRAESFLRSNVIPASYRQGLESQAFANRDAQLSELDTQLQSTLDDIRQRQAGRGLGSSSNLANLRNEAMRLADVSRQDIIGRATTGIEDQMRMREGFRQTGSRNIRSGALTDTATSRYQQDITAANSSFEKDLANALDQNQRNRAFQSFETNRRSAASRFQETVAQNNANSLLAGTASLGGVAADEDKETGQLGTTSNFTGV